MAWALLLIAGAFETIWALALKESDGFTRVGMTLACVLAGLVSVILLALALREIPVSTGYAVWTGAGAVGVTAAGILILGEPSGASRLIPIGLIAAGIVWLAASD